MALLYLRNREEAEEVSQDVFIKVFRKLPEFRFESSVTTWVYRIAVNTCLDYLRKRKRKNAIARLVSIFKIGDTEFLKEPPENLTPIVLMEQQENAAMLFAAIEKLPTNQKNAFLLSKMEGMAHEKIAEIMNTTLSAVESLLFRAKQNLKKDLEKKLGQNPNEF